MATVACGDSNSEVDTPPLDAGSDAAAADAGGWFDDEVVGDAGPTDCPPQYALGILTVMKCSWPETLGIEAGNDDVHIWVRLAVDQSGEIETVSCGSATPTITTKVIPGLAPTALKILTEIPDEAWDVSTMPKVGGTLTRSGSTATFEPGVSLLGFTLDDPDSAWPARGDQLEPVDHDDDGNPGITMVPRTGNGFSPPPASISDLGPEGVKIDRMYIAQRTEISYTAAIDGCPRRFRGSAEVRRFEYHVVGCHVRDGADCDASQTQFVDEQRAVFPPGPANFYAKMIPEDSTCADVRAALPAP